MSETPPRITPRRFAPDALPWRVARHVVLLGFVACCVGLIAAPSKTVDLIWWVVVPILPAVFFIDVRLWRNVCPLATLNVATGRHGRMARQSSEQSRVFAWIGIGLLALLVPSRHLVLNESAPVLAGVLVILAGVALWSGTRVRMKGGFCNAFCPVLPVERLYGLRPSMSVPNTRCAQCDACSKGCLDLLASRAPMTERGTAGRWRGVAGPVDRARTLAWFTTPEGAFAGGFPGLVYAYFSVPVDGGAGLFAGTILMVVSSWIAANLGARVFGGGPATWAATSAVLAGGTYYWFVPLGIAETYPTPAGFVWSVRLLAAGLIAFALLRPRSGPAPVFERVPLLRGSGSGLGLTRR